MANDDITLELLHKAFAKASATNPTINPWQEHFGRETASQARKSILASDVIQGFSGSWASSYNYGYGAGVSNGILGKAHQDPSVPKPIREKTTKLGQPGMSDVDFLPYNWHTNRFANKGPALVGSPISYEVVGPTMKSPFCDWTWEVNEGAGNDGGDTLTMSTRSDGGSAASDSVTSAYNFSGLDDFRGGVYLMVSSDGANPGSIPAGETAMGALPGLVDTARYELFRLHFISPPNGGSGTLELHPSKRLRDYFDLPVSGTRYIRAVTMIRPIVTRLAAVPKTGVEPGKEQTFVVLPPEKSLQPDNYPPFNGDEQGCWRQGGFDADGTGLLGAISAYGGKNKLPIPTPIRQGFGHIEKNPGAPTTEIGLWKIENVQNGDTSDIGRIMRIYHVDSDDGDTIDHGSVPACLGWFEIEDVNGGSDVYTLQRVVEVDPTNGQPYFGPGPYHMEPGAGNINVYFTIHDPIETLWEGEFKIDSVEAARVDCLIDPRDVERSNKFRSDTGTFPRPPASSEARGGSSIINTIEGFNIPSNSYDEVEDPGNLMDLGFKMVLFPAILDSGEAKPNWNRPIRSRELILDPDIDEEQYVEIDYSAGVIRLSHTPVPFSDILPNGNIAGSNNVRGEIVLFASCVPYSREPCQKGSSVRVASRGAEPFEEVEDIDVFSERITAVVDTTNSPRTVGAAPWYDGDVVLDRLLTDVPETGYFDLLVDTLDGNPHGTWGYQSVRVEDFGGGDVTVLESVYSEPGVADPNSMFPTVVIRREVFFGVKSADNSATIDDVRFDSVYGSSHRACVLRFLGSTVELQTDGSLLIDARGKIAVQDEGTTIQQAARFLNFLGTGVTAVSNGLGADITIPGSDWILVDTAAVATDALPTTMTLSGLDSDNDGIYCIIGRCGGGDGVTTGLFLEPGGSSSDTGYKASRQDATTNTLTDDLGLLVSEMGNSGFDGGEEPTTCFFVYFFWPMENLHGSSGPALGQRLGLGLYLEVSGDDPSGDPQDEIRRYGMTTGIWADDSSSFTDADLFNADGFARGSEASIYRIVRSP